MIALYNPRSSAGRKPILPHALLALGALLEGRYDWALVDGNLEADPLARLDALLTAAEDRQRSGASRLPPVLGITAMPGPQLADAVPLALELERRHPHAVIVWGGYFPTQHWRTCLASRAVDFVVRGHGEHGFLDLVQALAAGPTPERLREVPGLAWRDLDGLVANPMPRPPRFDALPKLPLHRVPVERYVRATFLGSRTLGHHSSYGCPYVCNFCAVTSLAEGRWTAQPAERVADTVADWNRRWGVNAVEFYDNNFFVSESRCREFSERIMPLSVGWWGEGRIDTLLGFSDRTWRRMAASGLRMVFMGAEAASAEALARMEKGGTLTPEMTLELVSRMREHRVVPELSFVVGSPPDPEADVEQTIAFVRRVKARNPDTEIVLYLYTPEPVEGALYAEAQAAGFRWPTSLEEWASPAWTDVVQRRSMHLPWIRPEARQRLRDFERVLNARYPTSTDPRLRGPIRRVLGAAAGWRWATGTYARPIELKALQKLVRYQRPETSGF